MEADGHTDCDVPLDAIVANNDEEKKAASPGNSGEQQQVLDAEVVNPRPPQVPEVADHREHINGRDHRKEEGVPPKHTPDGADDGTPPADPPAPPAGSSAAALLAHPSVVVVVLVLAAAAAMAGFASSYHFRPGAWMLMATTGWWHRPVSPGNATAAVDLLRHPSWTKVNDGLVRCLPSVNDTRDVDIRSFFDDARVQEAGAIDINNAMNRYLYMAIMNAVILGERLREDSSKSWTSGQKIGRRQVEAYLGLLLNTMNDVVITTLDSSASHFTEMNQYLHLTMVQTSVLVEKYPNDKKMNETEIVEKLEVELAQRKEEIRLLLVRVQEMEVTISHMEVKLESKVAEVVSLQSKCDLCGTQLKDCQAAAAAAAAKGLDSRDLSKTKPRPHHDVLHNDAGHFDARVQFRR